MATLAATLPRPRRRPVSPLAAGRASSSQIHFVFVKQIDNSRLVRELDVKKGLECYSLLGLGVLLFVFVFLFSWQHFQCVRDGYRIEQLKQQRAELQESNRQLRLEQAALADPQRIDTLARGTLGMVSPSPQQVIQVESADPQPQQHPESAEFARNFSAVGGDNPREP